MYMLQKQFHYLILPKEELQMFRDTRGEPPTNSWKQQTALGHQTACHASSLMSLVKQFNFCRPRTVNNFFK